MNALSARNLVFQREGRNLIDRVDLSLDWGELLMVLGPNGAGKSTLARLFSGELAPTSGQVLMGDRSLHSIPAREIARNRAVLMQHGSLDFAFTVRETVALSRLPHDDENTPEGIAIMERAMEITDVAGLANRFFTTLSGGEKQRVRIARVLAQVLDSPQPHRTLILDEPLAALDIEHQQKLIASLRTLADEGLAIMAVVHEPNLALRHAHRVVLLDHGRIAAEGAPDVALGCENLERVFHVRAILNGSGPDATLAFAPRN